MFRKIFLAGLTALALSTTSRVSADTYRQVLTASGIETEGFETARLDSKITSFATLNDPEFFLMAGYLDIGTGLLGDDLYVDLYQKSTKSWISRRLHRGDSGKGHALTFGGSVLGIMRSGHLLYLTTHANPSASFTLALDTNLNVVDSIYGWPLVAFPDGLLVFQNSEVHFAPTHYTEVSVFEPRTRKHWQIYPRKPYPAARLEQIAKVRAEYKRRGEEWFREHNHHGDPELFDNSMGQDIESSPQGHALIFRIAYDNTDTRDYSEKVKFQEFGGTDESLKAFQPTEPLPEGLFAVLGQELQNMLRSNAQEDFLRVFKDDAELSGMLRGAFATLGTFDGDWRKHFGSLDPRWDKPRTWQRLLKALEIPPETTEVVCVFRNIDREEGFEYREMLRSEFERRFGARPLKDYLGPDRLREIFAH